MFDNLDKIKGVIIAMITPFTSCKRVDIDSVKKLVAYLLSKNIHGLFLLGSAGECSGVLEEDVLQLINTVTEVIRKKIPVYVGTIRPSTIETIQRIRLIQNTAIDAIVVAPPFYHTLSTQEEVVRHYELIAKSSDLPILIYNIPSRVGINILPETIYLLSKIENIIGVKDSSCNWNQFQMLLAYFKSKNDKFKVFQGDESYSAEALLQGANGIVTGAGNTHPSLYVDLYNLSVNRETNKMFALQKKIDTLRGVRIGTYPIACIKAIASLMGLCSKEVIDPFNCITNNDIDKMKKILIKHSLF